MKVSYLKRLLEFVDDDVEIVINNELSWPAYKVTNVSLEPAVPDGGSFLILKSLEEGEIPTFVLVIE